jgi:hypothetical protein
MDLKTKFLKMNVKQLESLKKEYYGDEIKQTVIQKFIDYKTYQHKQAIKQKQKQKKGKQQLQSNLINDLIDDLIETNEKEQDDVPIPDEFELAKKNIVDRKSNNSRLACDIDVKNMQKRMTKKTFDPPYEI